MRPAESRSFQAAEQEFLSYSLLLSNLLCFKSFNRPSGMSDFRVRFVKGSHCVPDRAPGIPEKNESRFRLFRQQEKRGKISGIPLKLLEILTNAVCDFRRVSLSGHRNSDPEKEEIKDLKSAFFSIAILTAPETGAILLVSPGFRKEFCYEKNVFSAGFRDHGD